MSAVSDPGQMAIEDAYDNEETVQVWKVNLNKNKTISMILNMDMQSSRT